MSGTCQELSNVLFHNFFRFNGTLKRKLYKHFSQYNTKKWDDVLNLFVSNYNHSKHSSTGFSPSELQQAALDQNEEILSIVSERLKERAMKMMKPDNLPQIYVGDKVRVTIEHTVAKEKRTLQYRKHFLINWSKEIYTVKRISAAGDWHKPQYKLVNQHGRDVPHRFYRTDLLLINVDKLVISNARRPNYNDVFNIEKHLEILHTEGPKRDIVLPSTTQVQERRTEIGRIIKPRQRLIDELLTKFIRDNTKKLKKSKVLVTTVKKPRISKTKSSGEESKTESEMSKISEKSSDDT